MFVRAFCWIWHLLARVCAWPSSLFALDAIFADGLCPHPTSASRLVARLANPGHQSRRLESDQLSSKWSSAITRLALLGAVILALGMIANTSTASAQTYQQDFTQGTSYSSSSTQYTAWSSFRASLPSSGVTSITIRGSLDTVGRTCSVPATAQQIADAIRAGGPGSNLQTFSVSCGGFIWHTGGCSNSPTDPNNLELGVGSGGNCQCNSDYVVRPAIFNLNWGGIGNNCSAASQTLTVIVQSNTVSTTTVIASHNPNPSVIGQPYSVVVNVGSSSGTPTGTVTITDDVGNSCSASLSSGSGSCQLPSTQVGTRTITASYPANGSFLASSSTATHTITKGATTTSITSDTPAPSVVGQSYTVTVSVAASAPAVGTPTGTFTISNGTSSCTTPAISGGTASCALTSTSAGSATLTATYSGDSNFNTSSGTLSHTTSQGATTTTITADPTNPSVFGQAYTVTAAVAVTAPASGTPTGTFTISDGTSSCTTAAISGGSASCTIPAGHAPGSATLTATYSGDASFSTSSGTASHTVNKGATTTAITADPTNPSLFGQGYAVTATVSPTAPSAGTPTGTFTISDGTSSCTTAAISGGSASCTIPGGHAPGAATLTATYSGDASFTSSAGTASHTIDKAATTTTITSDTPDPSLSGQSYTVAVTVAPVAPASGVPTGTVTVSDGAGHTCPITLAAGAGSCSLSGTPVGSATLTASYAGDSNFTTSQGTDSHTVNKGSSATTVVSTTPNPTVFGQSYTVAVSVAAVSPASGTPTGSVTVGDGTSTCTIPALAGGTGSCSLAGGAPPGPATVTATYAGDASFTGSTGTGTHGVNQGATTTTITSSSPNPSVFGQPYTVAVSVAPAGAASGTATGSVTIGDGQGHTCTATLSSGAGSCSITGTSVGGATLTASYPGDASFAGSSGTAAHTVNVGATVTTITSQTPNPSLFGQSYTVAVSVAATAGAAGTPTGTVTITDGQGNSCPVTLAGGSGSCSLSGTAVGSATLTASYAGDTSFATSTGTATHTVNQGATTTTITSSAPNPSAFGQTYTVAVTVAAAGAASGTPTGSVTVSDGQGHTCTVTLAGGSGSCPLTGTSVGTATLTASYAGNTSFTASSGTASHTVDKGATTTVITSDAPDPSIFGQPYTIVVGVAPAGAAIGTPTGTITVSDGTNSCTTAPLSGGSASCVLSTTPVGSATLTATYAGDTSFSGSAGTDPHTVQQIPTTATVTSSVSPSLVGQPVTFTATVSPATATGTVTFKDGATVLGTAPVSGGTASITVSSLVAGGHTITAVYSGDTNHATTTSPGLTQTVTPNGTIVLAVVSGEGDGTFTFSSPTALLSTSVTTSGGSGQTSAISVNPGTYKVTVSLPDGFGLTSIQCNDADSSASVSGKTATLLLSPSEALRCTFTTLNSRKKTVEVVSRFMSRRNDLLVSNGPDQNRQIDRLLEASGERSGGGEGAASGGNGGSALGGPTNGPARLGGDTTGGSAVTPNIAGARGGTATVGRSLDDRLDELRSSSTDASPRMGVAPGLLNGSTEGTTRFSFATSLSQMMKAGADAENKKVQALLGDKGSGLGAGGRGLAGRTYSPFDIWFEGHYLSFADDRDRSKSDGHFGVAYLGADYIVSRNLLIGALVQWDSMEQKSTADAYSIKGNGWMAGPYATLRLSENVFLQGRTAFGRSSNEVSPFLTYTDSFETRRWLTTGTLAGRWKLDQWELRPSATLAYIEDVSSAYTDSLGVRIPGIRSSLGQLKAGPEVSYSYRLPSGMLLEPRFGVQAIWNFAGSDRVADFGGTLTGPEEVRGRVELGLRAKTSGGLGLDISGSYDGIGSDTFHSIGGRAMVRIPLQND